MQQVSGRSFFSGTASDLHSGHDIFPYILWVHCFIAHLVATLELTRTSPSLDELSHLLRLTACLSWPLIHPFPPCSFTSSLPRLCTLLFWLVLPWHRVARMRLHIQHLVFSSQRAADEIEGQWRKTHSARKQPCGLTLRTLQLCLTLVGLPSPVNTQQRDSRRLDHVGWLFVWFTCSCPTPFFFFFLVGSCF